MQHRADAIRREHKRIGLVPTMGFLHAGHLSLIHLARKHADRVVVSIFVNPTQFGPNEDFEDYPRDFERDQALCQENGADILFVPPAEAIYPPGFQSYVSLEALPHHLCGLSRPIHFRGVATVVAKLFNLVKPHVAVFGEKDYQQLLVIRQMARDLNFDIEVRGGPIVREEDGLAMSSRNSYLTPEQRKSAGCLHQSLALAQELVAQGERDPHRIIGRARALIQSQPDTDIDYIAITDPQTLEEVEQINGPVLMALAVKVGKPRLIDNAILNGPLP